jgi:hypothetical protein
MDEIKPFAILQAIGKRVARRLIPDRGEEKRPGLERQVLPEVLPKPRIDRRGLVEVDFENPGKNEQRKRNGRPTDSISTTGNEVPLDRGCWFESRALRF